MEYQSSDMSAPCDNGIINLRVGAIIEKNNKILMVKNINKHNIHNGSIFITLQICCIMLPSVWRSQEERYRNFRKHPGLAETAELAREQLAKMPGYPAVRCQ